ncbi:MAG: hypothetical protein M9951_03955 [Burkholderiaceae bacterium]|nr:hypothetical protein [Burkholderiaceae bacterium]MEB2319041.1 hypothetical protein [Pseudomonadota bacterium]
MTEKDKGRDGGDRATPKALPSQAHDSPTPPSLARLPWTDPTVDRAIRWAAAGRASVTIPEIMRAMGAADNDEETRASVWLRPHGETLLPGLLGHVQRANALRLMTEGGSLSGRDIEGVIRQNVPGASAALVDDVLSRFAEHLRNEGARLAAEADALAAIRQARGGES